MKARYGKAACPVNGAEVTGQTSVVAQTDYGMPLRYLVAYSVNLKLLGSGAADLGKQEVAFIDALKKDKQDFVLEKDDGSPSSSAIMSKETASGTRVISIATPSGGNGEFCTFRTIAFTVTAEYHVKNHDRAIVSWHETLTFVGTGGPRRSWRFPINNFKAIRQQITPASLIRATQTGTGVGYRVRPTPPRPLFPDYRVHEAEMKAAESPKFIGQDWVDYGVAWTYIFERGDGPLVGNLALPPGVV